MSVYLLDFCYRRVAFFLSIFRSMFQEIIDKFVARIQRVRKYLVQAKNVSPMGWAKKNAPLPVGLLFFGAMIIGVFIKLALSSFVTIGYDDYHSAGTKNAISLIELQEKTLREGGSLAYIPKQNSGPACTDLK